MSEKNKKEKLSEIDWDDVLAKEATFFTLNGRMGRFAYFSIFASWGVLERLIAKLDVLVLLQVVNLATIVSIILAVQKRCRDMHFKGSLLILMSSPMICVLQWFNYVRTYELPTTLLSVIPGYSAIIYAGTCAYLYLVLVPGKKEQTFTLTSPLLKYPIIYLGFWMIVYLVGFYVLFGRII